MSLLNNLSNIILKPEFIQGFRTFTKIMNSNGPMILIYQLISLNFNNIAVANFAQASVVNKQFGAARYSPKKLYSTTNTKPIYEYFFLFCKKS